MRFNSSPRSLGLWAALSTAVGAQYLDSDLSFGYGHRIAQEGHDTIEHWMMQGIPNLPEILSNKIIMTPPAPGNVRAALWSDKTLSHSKWTIDVDFRASGADYGSGNMNIWLVKDGANTVSTRSVYTVGPFEGMALVVNMQDGRGRIRGFLNDGAKDYNHQRVDSLSFGHCDYNYRNLGRPSQIKIHQNDNNFKVEVDGTLCFESNNVNLPTGYNVGITAASAENPDSFEIFKVVTMSEAGHDDHNNNHHQEQQHHQEVHHDESPPAKFTRRNGAHSYGGDGSNYGEEIADVEASKITSSKEQFEDLHNRIQSTNHHLSAIFQQITQTLTVGESRHEETSRQLGELKSLLNKLDRIQDIENRLANLDKDMRDLNERLQQRVASSAESIKYHVAGGLADHHNTMADKIKSGQGHGRLIIVIVLAQVLSLGGYVLYKRRKNGGHKKYL